MMALAQVPVPTPDPIPVPWGWFYALLLLTFLLHILLMNLLLGGSLLALWGRLRGRPMSAESKGLPTLVALTVNLGVPPLLFVQVLYGHLLYTSSVLMALFWILVIPVLILAYYAAYVFVHRAGEGDRLGTAALALSSAMLLAIGFVFVNNMTLMLQPSLWEAYAAHPGGTILNLGDPSLYPRYLHVVVGAVAVAGLGRAVYWRIVGARRGEEHAAPIREGLRVFAFATMAQVLIGMWFLLALPKPVMMLFMGKSLLGTATLSLGLLLSVAVIVTAMRGKLWLTTGLALVTLLDMVLMRDVVRDGYLAGVFHLGDLQVQSQVSPLIAFLVVFVLGLGLLFYMIRAVWSLRDGRAS